MRAECRFGASSATPGPSYCPRECGRYTEAVGPLVLQHHRRESDNRLGEHRIVADRERLPTHNIAFEDQRSQFLLPSQVLDAVRRVADGESAVDADLRTFDGGGRRRRAVTVFSA